MKPYSLVMTSLFALTLVACPSDKPDTSDPVDTSEADADTDTDVDTDADTDSDADADADAPKLDRTHPGWNEPCCLYCHVYDAQQRRP